MTNPRVTSPPLTTARAADDVDVLSRCFRVVHPPADVAERAMRIARQARFIRQDVYDAVLAATMLGNGVTRIYTVNVHRGQQVGNEPAHSAIPLVVKVTQGAQKYAKRLPEQPSMVW